MPPSARDLIVRVWLLDYQCIQHFEHVGKKSINSRAEAGPIERMLLEIPGTASVHLAGVNDHAISTT